MISILLNTVTVGLAVVVWLDVSTVKYVSFDHVVEL